MPKKKQKIGICCLCGEEATITREHVPPQGLFLKPLPSNMITVPTCERCNNGFKLDDEYFRICIATGADPEEKGFELWTEKVIGSTLKRSPALKSAILRDQENLIQFHKEVPLKTYDGRRVPDELVELALPFDANRINRVLVKIVRCLYYHHYEAVMPKAIHFVVSQAPLDEAHLEYVIVHRKGLIGTHNEFLYWFDLSGRRMAWALFFYLRHMFTIETMPSETGEEKISIRELR